MKNYEAVLEDIRAKPRAWLITGAAGFVGSNLLETLLKLDQRVVGLDNLFLNNRDTLDQVRRAVGERQWKNFRFVFGDIQSLDVCRQACRSVEVVLHQAAICGAPRSIVDPVAINGANVTGFLNMLVAAHGAGTKRFVYAGSGVIYGDHPGARSVESEFGAPQSPYALSKYVNELTAETFARSYGFPSIGLRYSNVFGPRQDPNGPYAATVPSWIAGMIRGEPVFIEGDGKAPRDFCYVEDVVQANLLAAATENPAALNQVYNVGASEAVSPIDLFETIRSLLEPRYPRLRDIQLQPRGVRAGHAEFPPYDLDKAGRLLSYRPAWNARRGLERTIGWHLAESASRSADPRVSWVRTATGGT